MIIRICAAAFPNRPDSCVHVEQKTLTLDRVGIHDFHCKGHDLHCDAVLPFRILF